MPPAIGGRQAKVAGRMPCSVATVVHMKQQGAIPHTVVRWPTIRATPLTRSHKVCRSHLASVRWAVKQLTGYRFNDQGSKETSSITSRLRGKCDIEDHTIFGDGPV